MTAGQEWAEFVCEDCGAEVAMLVPAAECVLDGRCRPCRFLAGLEPDERRRAEDLLFPEGRLPIFDIRTR